MNKLITFLRETGSGRFLLLLGIILIVFGIVMMNISLTHDTDNYIETTAVVSRTELIEEEHYQGDTHFDAEYLVFIKYMAEGKEYETEFGQFSDYKEGDKIRIMYNPDDPGQITQPGNHTLLSVIIIAAGVAALACSIVSFVRTYKKHKKMKLQEEEWTNGN